MSYLGYGPTSRIVTKLDSIAASFDGVETTFNLTVGAVSYTPDSYLQLVISVGGVMQEPGTAFTIDNDTIVFTAAPEAGSSFWGVTNGDNAFNGQYAAYNNVVDTFIGGVDYTAGTSNTVTLNAPPAGQNALEVFFKGSDSLLIKNSANATIKTVLGNGGRQLYSTYILYANNTIQFDTNIPVGVSEIEVRSVTAYAEFVPVPNSVSTAKLSNEAVSTAKIADDAVTLAKVSFGGANGQHIGFGASGDGELKVGIWEYVDTFTATGDSFIEVFHDGIDADGSLSLDSNFSYKVEFYGATNDNYTQLEGELYESGAYVNSAAYDDVYFGSSSGNRIARDRFITAAGAQGQAGATQALQSGHFYLYDLASARVSYIDSWAGATNDATADVVQSYRILSRRTAHGTQIATKMKITPGTGTTIDAGVFRLYRRRDT